MFGKKKNKPEENNAADLDQNGSAEAVEELFDDQKADDNAALILDEILYDAQNKAAEADLDLFDEAEEKDFSKGEGKTSERKKDSKKNAKKHKKKQKQSGFKTLTVLLIVILVAFSLIAYYKIPILVFFKLIDDPTIAATQLENRKKEKLTLKEELFSDFDAELVFGQSDTINILLFGLDEAADREDTYTVFRPDTIMVASINIKTKQLSIVSIPRDSYVTIYGHIYSGSGKDKINSCFAYGSYGHEPPEYFEYGIKCLRETVSAICGININYYIGIDMDGASAIIDAMGGVTVDVPTTVYDEMTWEPIVSEGDNQLLNGYQFLTLARHRQYSDGDIGRVRVQQMLIKTLFNQMKSAGNIMRLPKFISLAFDMIRTDITFEKATGLAFLLMEDFTTDKIVTGTMPGNFGNFYGISYWVINQSERVDFCSQMWGVSVSRLSQDPTYLADTPVEPEKTPTEGESSSPEGDPPASGAE